MDLGFKRAQSTFDEIEMRAAKAHNNYSNRLVASVLSYTSKYVPVEGNVVRTILPSIACTSKSHIYEERGSSFRVLIDPVGQKQTILAAGSRYKCHGRTTVHIAWGISALEAFSIRENTYVRLGRIHQQTTSRYL